MKNKQVLITGGNAGIGLATAIALAKMGAAVAIVSRSEEKAQAAIAEIKSKSGQQQVRYFIADLSNQASIKKLSEQVHQAFSKLDVLINNAGGVFSDFALSTDGIEMTMATNHFAYFQLSHLLLDLLKKSDAGRIVNVSSDSHYKGSIDFDSFIKGDKYFVLKAYAQSKLANVLFTQELAEQLKSTSITVNALHPGFVNTDIGKKGTVWYANIVWTIMAKLRAVSTEKGAETSIYLASSAEVKNVSGKYFADCKMQEPSDDCKNLTLQKALWEKSVSLCKI